MNPQSNIITLAVRIRDWQLSRALSDNELCKKFAGLGSTKTFKRILDGDHSELDIDRWLIKYGQVIALIELESQSTDQDEPIYDDLSHISSVRVAAQAAIAARGNNRLVIIEGPSGSGKTTASLCLAARFGRKVVLSEADETWKDSTNAMLGGLLRYLGIREIPLSAEARLTKLISVLCESPICLVIDEAHHLGPRTLNLVKTLINRTRCQFIFLCIETLFKKLECNAYEEAKQLTKNRLCERVKLAGPVPSDVESFLERRLKFEPNILKPCARALADRAPQHGNWNFVNLVTHHARQLAGKDSVDQEVFVKAVTEAASSR